MGWIIAQTPKTIGITTCKSATIIFHAIHNKVFQVSQDNQNIPFEYYSVHLVRFLWRPIVTKKCIYFSGLRIPFKTIGPGYNKNALNYVAFHLFSSSSLWVVVQTHRAFILSCCFNLSAIWLIWIGANLTSLGPSIRNNNDNLFIPQTKCT